MASVRKKVWKWMNKSNILTKAKAKCCPNATDAQHRLRPQRMYAIKITNAKCLYLQLHNSFCEWLPANFFHFFESKYQFPKKVSFQLSNNNFDAIKCMRMYHCEQLSFQCEFYSFPNNKSKKIKKMPLDEMYLKRVQSASGNRIEIEPVAMHWSHHQSTEIWKF